MLNFHSFKYYPKSDYRPCPPLREAIVEPFTFSEYPYIQKDVCRGTKDYYIVDFLLQNYETGKWEITLHGCIPAHEFCWGWLILHPQLIEEYKYKELEHQFIQDFVCKSRK